MSAAKKSPRPNVRHSLAAGEWKDIPTVHRRQAGESHCNSTGSLHPESLAPPGTRAIPAAARSPARSPASTPAVAAAAWLSGGRGRVSGWGVGSAVRDRFGAQTLLLHHYGRQRVVCPVSPSAASLPLALPLLHPAARPRATCTVR